MRQRTIILRNGEGEEGFGGGGGTSKRPELNCSAKIKTVMLNNDDGDLKLKIGDVSKIADYKDLTLSQFCAKGSMNSAFVGGCIQPGMVKYVLSRGCRVLDFEVYYVGGTRKNIKKGIVPTVCIGFNEKPNAIASNSKNVIPLENMLKQIIPFAFSNQFWKVDKKGQNYSCPNRDDPLFIRLRMKTAENDKMKLYKLIQESLNAMYCDRKYRDYFMIMSKEQRISGKTPIHSLFRKIVFIFQYEDSVVKSNANFYDNLLRVDKTMCKDGEEGNMATIVVNNGVLEERKYGEVNLNKYLATPPVVTDTLQIDAKKWVIVTPDNHSSPNVDSLSGIKNYGFQIYMMQYDKNDVFLRRNEQMHNVVGTAFVPVAVAVRYVNGVTNSV